MPPVILFQPLNRIGLGHTSRLSAIALALRQMDGATRTPFVVDGASHVLLDALGLPYVPLPSSHSMYRTDRWDRWSKPERFEMAVALSHTILGALRPGVVVFDGLPNRAFLRASVEAEVPCAICLREAKKGVYEERLGPHLAHFQCVIVPHDPGDYEIPRELEARTHFVGPIVRPMTAPPRESHERPVVLITGGGGGYPGTVHFYNLALKAFAEARREDPRLDGRLVTGPLFDDWARLELVDGARVAPFDPHLTEGFAQADLVVCQCGYNTMAELERVGTRTILVPAARTLDDQFARAQRLARTYPHFSTFVGSSPQELGRLIVDAVAEGRRPPAPRPVADRGAERAAAILRAMATQREP